MVSLALMDRVLAVDPVARTVTAQAGARVADVTAALRPHGLTLPVFASIKEQSLGGYTQAGVHGTGARIPPADAAVRGLTLVTPGRGTLRLAQGGTPDDPDGALFRLAVVGLGVLGVVADVTLACDAATWLVEETSVVTRGAALAQRDALLAAHRHVRFMWIPHTDAVVVVVLDEAEEGAAPPVPPVSERAAAAARAHFEKLVPAALALRGEDAAAPPPDHLDTLSPMLLRQWLLSSAPLDVAWVKKVNAAEAAFWTAAAGGRAGWSDELLGFDCAGAQWVLEVALPTGTLAAPSGADKNFMVDLLAAVEAAPGLPAPGPIEQRWTAASPTSAMSPAASPNADDVFSWVGVIMYLPDPASPVPTPAVATAFDAYAALVERDIGPRYGATEHWAKIEPRRLDVAAKRAALAARFPVAAFAAARAELDPHNVLGGVVVDAVLPHPGEAEQAGV
jgi:L-galactono-1,4-lactone dehydrogenase